MINYTFLPLWGYKQPLHVLHRNALPSPGPGCQLSPFTSAWSGHPAWVWGDDPIYQALAVSSCIQLYYEADFTIILIGQINSCTSFASILFLQKKPRVLVLDKICEPFCYKKYLLIPFFGNYALTKDIILVYPPPNVAGKSLSRFVEVCRWENRRGSGKYTIQFDDT